MDTQSISLEKLESKVATVTRHIAHLLLAIAPGERMPTTSQIASELGVGFGTVEKAVAALRDNRVITTRARGQMGTFLLGRDLPRQWSAAGHGAATGLLPMPNSMHFIGLATGITAWFEQAKIPFTLNFKNGSVARLAGLKAGRADFIAVSKLTAERICAQDDNIVAVVELPERSYYGGHHIVFRSGLDKPRQQWIIGVDPTSLDHVAFCDALFPDSSKQEVRYVHLPYAIASGQVDASPIHSRYAVTLEIAQSLSIDQSEHWDDQFTTGSAAVILCRRDNVPTRTIFTEAPDTGVISKIQKSVIEGEHEPAY